MSTPTADEPRVWHVAVIVLAIFAAILAATTFLVTVAGASSDTVTDGAAAAEPADAQEVTVELDEWALKPESVTVAEGGRIVVTNIGAVPHTLGLEGTDLETPVLQAGEEAVLDLAGLATGTYELLCTVGGHPELGMTGSVVVGASADDDITAAPDTVDGDHAAHGDGAKDWEEMDRIMRERTEMFPAETAGKGSQILEPNILPDGTKEWELTTSIIEWEIEPGKTVEGWAYNGMIPGPTLKGEVGDNVRIVLHNELPESTAIHFHGLKTPNAMDGVPDITQEPVRPGETFVYEFELVEDAVGMYHAHHHADHQIPNGLAGTFLVGQMPVPDGIEVSQEITMMLNDAGTIGYSLNGKSFPATDPIVAKQGEYVMVHYMNEGLQIHPMHLHSLNHWVIAKDGFPLPEPWRMDTVNVAPGERWTILVEADQLGVWAWHCHILTHAETPDGMFGMVTAMIVEE
jgi:manganese oxidase